MLYRQLEDSNHQPRPLDARFEEGIYIGIHDISGEVLIGVGEHVLRGAETRRLSEDIRWDENKVMAVRATAIQPNPGQEDLRLRTHIRDPAPQTAPLVGQPSEGNHDARQVYLKKQNFEGDSGAGYTPGCPRCAKMRLGLQAAGPHNSECRARLAEHLAK